MFVCVHACMHAQSAGINTVIALGTTQTVQWFYTANITREIFLNDPEITRRQN